MTIIVTDLYRGYKYIYYIVQKSIQLVVGNCIVLCEFTIAKGCEFSKMESIRQHQLHIERKLLFYMHKFCGPRLVPG